MQPAVSTNTAVIFDQSRELSRAEQDDEMDAMTTGFIASVTADAQISSARSRENWELLRKVVKESIRKNLTDERQKEILAEIAARPTSQTEAKDLDKELEKIEVDEEKVAKAVMGYVSEGGNANDDNNALDEAEWILKEMLRREAADMLEANIESIMQEGATTAEVMDNEDNEDIPPRREAEPATFERNADMEQVRRETAAEEEAAARKI